MKPIYPEQTVLLESQLRRTSRPTTRAPTAHASLRPDLSRCLWVWYRNLAKNLPKCSYCQQEQAPGSSPPCPPAPDSGTAAVAMPESQTGKKIPIASLSREGGKKGKLTSTAQKQKQCCWVRRPSTCSQQTSRQGQRFLTSIWRLEVEAAAFLPEPAFLLRIRHKLLMIFIYQLEIRGHAGTKYRVLLTDDGYLQKQTTWGCSTMRSKAAQSSDQEQPNRPKVCSLGTRD